MPTEKVLVIRSGLGCANLKIVVSDADQEEDRCFACSQPVQFDHRKRGCEAADILFENTSSIWLKALWDRLNERYAALYCSGRLPPP